MAVQLSDVDSDRRTCDFCGTDVTSDFRRTYGTNHRRAKWCPECDSWPQMKHGFARGEEVNHPDPQVNSARNGGKQLRHKRVTDGGDSS